jgi:hypothetical protein
MHLFSPEVGLMGTSGIVGPSILQATGAGYSFKLLKTDQIGVAFFGDGGSNNGAFHEGLNLASIWDLPVLFVCENNLYATEVPQSAAGGNPNVAERAVAYMATTCWPSMRLPVRLSLGLAAGADRPLLRLRPIEPGPMPKECVMVVTELKRK